MVKPEQKPGLQDIISLNVTNGLGFRALRSSFEKPFSAKSSKRVYAPRTDLYMHLAKMDSTVAEDLDEKTTAEQFILETREWRKGLGRIGMSDFDVKRPEELVDRLAEFRKNGPLVRKEIKYVPTTAPVPGFFQIRQDAVLLAAGVLVTLLTTTHTEVLEASYNRTTKGFQDKCANDFLPQFKSDYLDQYNDFLNFHAKTEDPDSELTELCTQTALRAYERRDDLDFTDGEAMFRTGFSLTMLGGITATAVGVYLLGQRIGDFLRNRRNQKST